MQEMHAIEFCRMLSGRTSPGGVFAVEVPF
jgi:hypothetical protein